uniref:Uncharacterized protein n=1 Tax=Aegilops tauschii subsp. strangulata TaxID=200361 RepID=A0A453QBT3_AEGTS
MIEDDVQQHVCLLIHLFFSSRTNVLFSLIWCEQEDRESAIRLYQENLATLDRVKKHQEFMRARVGFLEKGNKCLSWSLLLMPILTVAVILKAIAG